MLWPSIYLRRPAGKALQYTALLCTALLCPTAADAASRTYIDEGQPLNIRTEGGTWARSGSYFGSSSNGAVVSLGDLITTGDFSLQMVLRGESFATNPGSILINEIGEFGLVRTDSASPMFVRGFFFGDITRNLTHRRDFISDTEDFTFSITRTGDIAKIGINGQNAWTTTYEADREFGKVSIRNSSGRLKIRSAVLTSGNVANYSHWKSLRTMEHDMPGEQVDVFSRGSGGYHTYRIPAVEMTRTGTLLAFCEGRRNSGSDSGDIDLLMKRSTNGGRTWGPQQVIHTEPGAVTIGNPVPVHDHRTNITWLAICRNNDRVFITKSHNDGATWDSPREITADVKLPEWGWYATGPGHGLVTTGGRIIIPANHGSKSHTFYSDDLGQTWQLGGIMPGYGNEVTVAETSDNQIYMNSRNRSTAWFRLASYSSNGSQTWGTPQQRIDLVEPTCQGSVRSITTETGEHLMLFSNPASMRRERITVRLSENDGTTWSAGRRLYEGSAAYSDLVYLGDGWVGCLYERDWYDHLTFARFHLSWLRDSRVDHWTDQEVTPPSEQK